MLAALGLFVLTGVGKRGGSEHRGSLSQQALSRPTLSRFGSICGENHFMKARTLLASLVLTVVVSAVQAQQPAQPPGDISKVRDELQTKERILASRFAEFENSLLKLKDSLKRSGK